MNDTKWDELRLAMYGLGPLQPKWRTRDIESGYVSPWDGEWFYHFRDGGYRCIEWLDIKISSRAQDDAVLNALKSVHVPGHPMENGYKVYGYAQPGVVLDYF